MHGSDPYVDADLMMDFSTYSTLTLWRPQTAPNAAKRFNIHDRLVTALASLWILGWPSGCVSLDATTSFYGKGSFRERWRGIVKNLGRSHYHTSTLIENVQLVDLTGQETPALHDQRDRSSYSFLHYLLLLLDCRV